jgi:hypothetical protein
MKKVICFLLIFSMSTIVIADPSVVPSTEQANETPAEQQVDKKVQNEIPQNGQKIDTTQSATSNQEPSPKTDQPKTEQPKVVGKASQESARIARRKDLTNYAVAAFAVGGAILGLILISMHGKHAHHSH